jgi:hypothetical protein
MLQMLLMRVSLPPLLMFSFRSNSRRAVKTSSAETRNGDPVCWQRQRNAPRRRSLC